MAGQSSQLIQLMLIVGVILISSLPLSNSLKLANKCSEQRTLEMDACAAKMGFLGDHSFKVPKNMSSMDRMCANLKENLNCIQVYMRDCLEGFTKQLMVSSLKRGKQQYSLICQDEQSRRQFMSRMSCLADDKIDRFHLCMDGSVARMEFILSAVERESKLLALCCSYQIFNADIDSTLDRICGKPKERKSSINEFIERITGGTAGELYTLMCEGHRSQDDCKKSAKTQLIMANLEAVTQRVHQAKLKPKHKSVIPPLLEILDTSSSST